LNVFFWQTGQTKDGLLVFGEAIFERLKKEELADKKCFARAFSGHFIFLFFRTIAENLSKIEFYIFLGTGYFSN
jgi:hypothetical protein